MSGLRSLVFRISNSQFKITAAPSSSLVIARLDRATQYSRGVSARAERPRRTGSPAFAGDDSGEDKPPHHRGATRPSYAGRARPKKIRGRRECRVRAAPAVSCAKCTKESAHEHTGSAEAIRHSLRNGLTAYAVLSPATNSSCHRRWRIEG